MAQSPGATPTDPLRKAVIVAVLVAAMVLLYRFAIPGAGLDPTGMLALGFVVLAGFTIGELAQVVGLPHITGYLVGGLLMGTSVAHALPHAWQVGPFRDGILNPDVLQQLDLFNTLALALIALTAGGELKLETLRREMRPLAGVLGGQTLTVIVGVLVLTWVVGGGIPAIALPGFVGLDTSEILSFGLLLAPVMLATSPAATIAVINGVNARGPMTQIVLSTVVLKDVLVVVLFSVAGALVGYVLGQHAIQVPLGSYLLVHVLGSLALGVLVGGGLALYLRFVRAETLLFLVGLIYTATFVAQQLHFDPLLLFLAAGFVTSNFSREGDAIIQSVERLSMPVYVVFFTLAGAGLHLDSLVAMAPFAVALVAVRALAFWMGVGAGASFAGTDEATRRYGWMGFMSQAGVALSLAAIIGSTYGEPGEVLRTWIIAALALNELIGPVLLKAALGLAGEIRVEKGEVAEQAPTEVSRLLEERPKPWAAPESIPDPWGGPPDTASEHLNNLAYELEGDLQALVRDLLQGPLAAFSESGSGYLRALRREFLRHHRRVNVRLAGNETDDLAAVLRREQANIAERWRGIVLDRSARIPAKAWNPVDLVEAVDTVVETLPEVVAAPWEEQSFAPDPDESPWIAVRRGLLRMRNRWYRLLGRRLPEREVRVRDLARYHLCGVVPTRLEPLAALLVNAESHLAHRTRAIFDLLVDGYDTLATLIHSEEVTLGRLEKAMGAIRAELDQEFATGAREIDHIVQDGAIRAAVALGGGLRGYKEDLPRFGTLDLPNRLRRYSRVFSKRARGIEMLGTRTEAARRGNAAQYSALALELELVGFEASIKRAVESQGSQLCRMVRGRGPTQLARVVAALEEALTRLEEHIHADMPGDEMAARIRAIAEPLEKVVGEAGRTAIQLREYLGDEEGISPLLDELAGTAAGLTDRYMVPIDRVTPGEQTLPRTPGTTEVPLRELTIAFIESSVSQGLASLSHEFGTRAERLSRTLDELERVVAFNVELAGAELDVLAGEPVPAETRGIVHEMLLGALGRSGQRLKELAAESESWPDLARDGVRKAILGDLEAFRNQVADGRITELRLRMLRERAASGRLAREAEELTGGLRRLRTRLVGVITNAVGRERLDQARRALGVPISETATELTPDIFSPPGDPEALPVVYRRLFSDQALEAGDLLTGRQAEIARARRALSGAAPGRRRAVAIIGMDGAGKSAVVNGVVRSTTGMKVVRLVPREPVDLATVEGWFADLNGGELVVLDGVKWLFCMCPGGFAPLRRFVDGVIAHPEVVWLTSVSTAVWTYACRAAPLEDAFPEAIQLRPLVPGELQSALLARHSMSGYELRFEAQQDLAWQVQHLLSRSSDFGDRQRDAWFRALHRATGGVIHDALVYWMASVQKVDQQAGVVQVGPVPHPPIAALGRLSEDVLLTLSQVMRQGWITPEVHADLFRRSRSLSAAHLGRLAHYGLLELHDGRFRISPHLLTPVHQVLSDRGWLA